MICEACGHDRDDSFFPLMDCDDIVTRLKTCTRCVMRREKLRAKNRRTVRRWRKANPDWYGRTRVILTEPVT